MGELAEVWVSYLCVLSWRHILLYEEVDLGAPTVRRAVQVWERGGGWQGCQGWGRRGADHVRFRSLIRIKMMHNRIKMKMIKIKMIQIKVIKMMDSHQVQVWVSVGVLELTELTLDRRKVTFKEKELEKKDHKWHHDVHLLEQEDTWACPSSGRCLT